MFCLLSLVISCSFMEAEKQKQIFCELVSSWQELNSKLLGTLEMCASHIADLLSIDNTSRPSDKNLRELYQEADIFTCFSHHEGFCIPLVEAIENNRRRNHM